MSAETLTAPDLRSRISVVAHHWVILLGATLLTVPTLISVAKASWSTEAGAHGPLVIATGAWLIATHAAAFRTSIPGRAFLPATLLAFSLLAYAIGRITALIFIEMAALYAVYFFCAVLVFGAGWIRKLWFPLLYFLFALPIPENIISSATQPLKLAISSYAVEFLAAFGYSVGRAGVILQVDQYQLLIATACTGVNSMTGITALSIFYVYLRYAQNWRLALLLVLLVIPIGMLLNFLRVIILVLQTHYLGDASAQSFTHELSAFFMFALTIGTLFALEKPMNLLARKLGWREQSAQAAPASSGLAHEARDGALAVSVVDAPASRRELIVGGVLAAAAAVVWWRMPRMRSGLAEGVAIKRIIPESLNGWAAMPGGNFIMPEADEALQASIYEDVLTRSYVRGDTVVMMLIAYSRTQTHMLHIHRPEMCYPASGFTITQPRPVSISVGQVPAFTGAFMTAKSIGRTDQVLSWIRIGNEFPVTFTQQHLAIARQNLLGDAPDGALVRMSISTLDAEGALEDLLHFARALAAETRAEGRTLLLGPEIAAELGGPVTR